MRKCLRCGVDHSRKKFDAWLCDECNERIWNKEVMERKRKDVRKCCVTCKHCEEGMYEDDNWCILDKAHCSNTDICRNYISVFTTDKELNKEKIRCLVGEILSEFDGVDVRNITELDEELFDALWDYNKN